ncbi:MAG: hypothetical protein JKY37_09900 [Nannocystaceae bacterium]|nr:hypothetical protein [Nannocystaceae bacterium]
MVWFGPTRWLTLLALVTTGCADDRDPCEYEVCDIADRECVQWIAEAVACQREVSLVVPRVVFATAAEVVGDDVDPTPEELKNFNDYYAGEALVGLMPGGYDAANEAADSLSGFVAFYSGESKEVVIISDAVSSDPEQAYSVLVHEMIHVYQDAEYDLATVFDQDATTFDRSLGLRAGIEGEATWYQLLASLDVDGVSEPDVDWPQYFGGFQAAMFDEARDTETPTLDALGFFPYAFGSDQAHKAWLDGGAAAVSDLVLEPADSVRQIMAGYDARPPDAFNLDEQLSPHAVPILPGHTLLGGGYQSAWLVNAMLQRTAGARSVWSSVLEGIAADHLSIFRNDATGESVAVWRFVEDERSTTSLRDALVLPSDSMWRLQTGEIPGDETLTHLVAELDGDTVLVATGGPGAEALLATVTGWESPKEAQDRAGLYADYRSRSPTLWMQRALGIKGPSVIAR